MKRKLLVAAFGLFGSLLSGCAAHSYYGAGYGPPPPPRYGVIGVAPGPVMCGQTDSMISGEDGGIGRPAGG